MRRFLGKPSRFAAALLAAAALAGLGSPAFAERRVALVIGNAAYRNAAPLRTPTGDADRVSAVLRSLDFAVTEVKDVEKRGMEQALRRFAEDISGADIALFYYSGHGIQVGDDNYILPVSARVDSQRNLTLDAFGVLDIDEMMRAAGAHVQLLFLDACRNNPFAAQFAAPGSLKSRSILPPKDVDAGALIAFAAAPGQVAADGMGDDSPFTEGFLKYAATPNIDVRQMLARVRSYVSDETAQNQVPWDNSSLVEDVFLVPKRAPPEFARLSRVHLPASGSGEMRLPRPVQRDGGKLKIAIEQAPAAGALALGAKRLAAGEAINVEDFDKLAYRRENAVASDAFSFRVSDDWGHSDVGLVAIDFEASAAVAVATPTPEPAAPRLDASLTALSLIGVGPNLRLRDPAPTSGATSVPLKLMDDPAFGQFRLGDRVIGKDHVISVADLPRLVYVPPVGVEGKTLRARFVAANGGSDAVELNVDVALTDCDRLAGDILDVQGVTAGVLAGRIDLDAALPACELAVKLQPKSGRFAYELARVYAGLGRNGDATATYQKAADLGHIRALWALGYRALYLRPIDAATGIRLLKQASAAGDVYADHTLGQAYYEGRGVEKDWVEARKLFEKAAQAGHTFAMNSLGRMYQRGETVAADPALARRFWEESAARGDIYGLDNLGFVYLEGVGAPKDPAKALDYFRQASDLGHPEAPNNIGRLYLLGLGVAKNPNEARRWYELGMNRGDGWAAYNLGELTRDGVGGPADKAKAGYFFARAAASNNRPEPPELGRKALAALDAQSKAASLRLLIADLNPAAKTASEAALPALASEALAAQGVTPASAETDDLLIATGEAIFVSKRVRGDLF